MGTTEVSLGDRYNAKRQAEEALLATAERWLDARTLGIVPEGLDSELDAAIRKSKRARSAYKETEKRLARRLA